MTPEQILDFAEGLARVAASGAGPKALATYLAGALEGSVIVEDVLWRNLAAAGAAPPPSARATDDAAAGRAVRPHPSTPDGRTLPIWAGDVHLGWLSACGRSARDPKRFDVMLRLTAATLAVELARARGRADGRLGFWERLLAHEYHDAAAARDDAAAGGVAVAPNYIAVALEPETGSDGQPAINLTELRHAAGDAFRTGGEAADLGFLERGTALLVFVPVAREIDASNVRTAATLFPKTIAKRKPGVRISGGAGGTEPLLAAGRSAETAQIALTIGRRIHGSGRVTLYDDLGAYGLLYEGADTARLLAFSRDVLAPLRAYDDKHQTELERTLRLYFQVGENVKTAATQLNVHRHTVFYRLRQIAEISARSLETPHDQLTLRLAVAIDALHSG
jgi:purine catabolism regulator